MKETDEQSFIFLCEKLQYSKIRICNISYDDGGKFTRRRTRNTKDK